MGHLRYLNIKSCITTVCFDFFLLVMMKRLLPLCLSFHILKWNFKSLWTGVPFHNTGNKLPRRAGVNSHQGCWKAWWSLTEIACTWKWRFGRWSESSQRLAFPGWISTMFIITALEGKWPDLVTDKIIYLYRRSDMMENEFFIVHSKEMLKYRYLTFFLTLCTLYILKVRPECKLFCCHTKWLQRVLYTLSILIMD